MTRQVAAHLRAEFPDGEAWGWRRIVAERSIFWDGDHRRLTDLSNHQIFIALIWANFYAGQWGCVLQLNYDENKLWKRHFQVSDEVTV